MIHPAQYPEYLLDDLIAAIEPHAVADGWLCDPFAGLGRRLAYIAERVGMQPIGVEIEPGYFDACATHSCVIQGDALRLKNALRRRGIRRRVSVVVTSPTYPNGVNDYFHAQDSSRRNTYIHRLRAVLGNDYEMRSSNTGRYNARRGDKSLATYWGLHESALAQWPLVLPPGGIAVVNTKDVRVGKREIEVADGFRQILEPLGFEMIEHRRVFARGLRHGANYELRAEYEDIATYRLTRKATA